MAKRVRLRQLAATDLHHASESHRRDAGEQTALRFIDDVERGMTRIGRNPQMGSLQFAYELGIPDLRAWRLQRFPHIVFYVIADQEIDVWRILHDRRDLQAELAPDDTSLAETIAVEDDTPEG